MLLTIPAKQPNPLQNMCTQCQLSSLLLYNKEQVRYTQIGPTKYEYYYYCRVPSENMRRNSIACNKRPIDFLPNNEIGFVITPTALAVLHTIHAPAPSTQ